MDIFKTGLYDYSELGYDKPIYYTEEVLNEAISDCKATQLTIEHNDTVVGALADLSVRDGVLVAGQSAYNKDISKYSFSPLFKINDIIDKGDYYLPQNVTLQNVGLTNNPRKQILPNSTVQTKPSDNMSDNTIDNLVNSVKDKEETIASLQNELNKYKEKISQVEKLEAKVDKFKKENKALNDELDDIGEKAKLYDKDISKKKQELLNDLFGEKEENQEAFKDLSFEQLNKMKESKIVNTIPKGVGVEQAEGLNEPEPAKDPDKYTYSDFKKDYIAAYGTEPSVINE